MSACDSCMCKPLQTCSNGESENPIVLPEVSNSHRGGHPPLPPPSSLHNLKITEVGEGEGGATSFGEKVGDGGGSTAATSFLWSHF